MIAKGIQLEFIRDTLGYIRAGTADVNEPWLGWTPLHWACSSGEVTVVQELITASANVHAKAPYSSCTPLHCAVKSKMVLCVQCLLDAGADIEARDSRGRTPLCVAADRGSAQAVRLLIAKGANVNATDHWKDSPLILACRAEDFWTVFALVEAEAELNHRNEGGCTALYTASETGNPNIVQYLMHKGAEPRTHVLCAEVEQSQAQPKGLEQAMADLKVAGS